MLRALPRVPAPPRLARHLRRALARERRKRVEDSLGSFWPTAVVIQVALLGALCAIYLLVTPPTAVVVEPASSPTTEPALRERGRATTSKATEASNSSQPNRGPTRP